MKFETGADERKAAFRSGQLFVDKTILFALALIAATVFQIEGELIAEYLGLRHRPWVLPFACVVSVVLTAIWSYRVERLENQAELLPLTHRHHHPAPHHRQQQPTATSTSSRHHMEDQEMQSILYATNLQKRKTGALPLPSSPTDPNHYL